MKKEKIIGSNERRNIESALRISAVCLGLIAIGFLADQLGFVDNIHAINRKLLTKSSVATRWDEFNGYSYDTENYLAIYEVDDDENKVDYERHGDAMLCDPVEGSMDAPICDILADFIEVGGYDADVVRAIYENVYLIANADEVCGEGRNGCLIPNTDPDNSLKTEPFVVVGIAGLNPRVSDTVLVHEFSHFIGAYGASVAEKDHEILTTTDPRGCIYFFNSDLAYYCTEEDSGVSCQLEIYPEIIATTQTRIYMANHVDESCDVHGEKYACGGYDESMLEGENIVGVLPRHEVKKYREQLYLYFRDNPLEWKLYERSRIDGERATSFALLARAYGISNLPPQEQLKFLSSIDRSMVAYELGGLPGKLPIWEPSNNIKAVCQ